MWLSMISWAYSAIVSRNGSGESGNGGVDGA